MLVFEFQMKEIFILVYKNWSIKAALNVFLTCCKSIMMMVFCSVQTFTTASLEPARIRVFDRRGGVLSDRTVRAILSEFARLSVSMRSGNRDEWLTRIMSSALLLREACCAVTSILFIFFLFLSFWYHIMHETFARLGFVSTGPWIRFNLIGNEKSFFIKQHDLVQTLSLISLFRFLSS